MNKMLYDSNSVSLMSIDNSSSSEPVKKLSPVKFAPKSWWEEIEAAEQTVFKQEVTVHNEPENQTKRTEPTETTQTENKTVTTTNPDMFTFTNKIKIKDELKVNEEFKVKAEYDDVNKDESNYQFSNKTIESNDTTASNSRKSTIELLNSSNNGDKSIRDFKVKTPFKRRLSGESRSNSPTSFFPIKMESEIETENANDDAELVLPTTENSRAESAGSSHTSGSNGHSNAKRRRCNMQLETSVEVLARRQKQIDYGKNTIGYDNYIKQIPRNKRSKDHPWTPPKQFKYSRRAFDGLVKGWRTKLHCFDPPNYKVKNEECASSESTDEEDDDDK